MRTILFFAVTGSLIIVLVHWVWWLALDRRASSVTLDRIESGAEEL